MMSFSSSGIPISVQSPPAVESHPSKSTFWWVKKSSMFLRGTPRSVEKWKALRPTPTMLRPLGEDWAGGRRRLYRSAGLEAKGDAARCRPNGHVGDAVRDGIGDESD